MSETSTQAKRIFDYFSLPVKRKDRIEHLQHFVKQEGIHRFDLVDAYLELAREIGLRDPETAFMYLDLANKTSFNDAGQIDYAVGEAISQTGRAFILSFQNEPHKSLEILKGTCDTLLRLGAKRHLSDAYLRLGSVYWSQAEFDIGFDYMQKSKKISEEFNDRRQGTWSHYMLAGFYFDLADYDKCRESYEQALEGFSEMEDEVGIGRCVTGLGSVYTALGEYEQALEFCLKGVEIQEQTGGAAGLSRAHNDLGRVYKGMKEYELAENFFLKAYEARMQLNSLLMAAITSMNDLGELYMAMGRFEESKKYLLEAEEAAKRANSKAKLYTSYQLLGELHKKTNEPWAALEYFELFYKVKSEVLGDENQAKIKNIKSRYTIEVKEQEAEIYRLKNVELREAYEEIEEQNKNIKASIQYAKRIQLSVLPPMEQIKEHIPQFSLFYNPRDIVSGDFYFFTEKDDLLYLAAVDCTGHGVPGAFMTLMGNDFLSSLISENELSDPAQILSQLDKKLVETLHQNLASNETNDGMDISLCRIDKANKILTFAGAKQPLVHIQKNGFKQIKGGLFPVGGGQFIHNKVFENHVIPYEEGDIFFIYSDGFQDQFGGPSGRKYMTSRFREFLFGLSKMPVSNMAQVIEKEFLAWKGQHKQTDDVLVMAFSL